MPDAGKDLTTAEGYKAPTIQSVDDLRPTRSGVSFEITHECVKCHLQWKESEMVVLNGKYYGRPCGCSKDIPQLLSRGR